MSVDLTKLPDYPFTPKRFNTGNNICMSYLDEGPRDGEVLLMLHGNPSWSYYWRHLVLGLRDRYRCIVPDHVGMGLSDKPGDKQYRYTLQSRVDDLDAMLKQILPNQKVTLVVHDWGGMIGFGWALANFHRVSRLVILNTAAFPLPKAKKLPWQLKLGRNMKIGAFIIRAFNAFSAGAAWFGTERSLSWPVKRAFTAPYNSWKNRIATLRFIQDIPLTEKDPAWDLVKRSGDVLHTFADRPAFIGWGLRDFVFDKHFLEQFCRALPNVEVSAFEDAGHYVLEDKPEVLVPAIKEFLDRHPLHHVA